MSQNSGLDGMVGSAAIVVNAVAFVTITAILLWAMIVSWPTVSNTQIGSTKSAGVTPTATPTGNNAINMPGEKSGGLGEPPTPPGTVEDVSKATVTAGANQSSNATKTRLPLVLSALGDSRFILVMFLLGALGAMLHVLRSFSWYVGNQTLKWSWMILYYLTPFIGGILAVAIYVVLRGGLLPGQPTSQEANPYGFAAIAVLVGIFSQQASEKLKQVFETLFTPAPQGSNYTPPQSSVQSLEIDSLSPFSGSVGSKISIKGKGFSNASGVSIGGSYADFRVVSDVEIEATVRAGSETGVVEVSVGAAKATSKEKLTISP